jgi:hypothetical protein
MHSSGRSCTCTAALHLIILGPIARSRFVCVGAGRACPGPATPYIHSTLGMGANGKKNKTERYKAINLSESPLEKTLQLATGKLAAALANNASLIQFGVCVFCDDARLRLTFTNRWIIYKCSLSERQVAVFISLAMNNAHNKSNYVDTRISCMLRAKKCSLSRYHLFGRMFFLRN